MSNQNCPMYDSNLQPCHIVENNNEGHIQHEVAFQTAKWVNFQISRRSEEPKERCYKEEGKRFQRFVITFSLDDYFSKLQ